MSIYERSWSSLSPSPTPTPNLSLSDDASKTLTTYLAFRSRKSGEGQITLKDCTVTDDRVIAGVRSTTFTAVFRDENGSGELVDGIERDIEVGKTDRAEESVGIEGEKGVGEGEEGEEGISERAHLTIRLFVGSGMGMREEGK